MLVLVGILVVTISVVGGFVMEGGPIAVLIQPVEFLIIAGAAVGGLLTGTSPATLRQLMQQGLAAMRPSPYTKALYLDGLQLLYELLVKAKKNGLISLEKDLGSPGESPVFANHPTFAIHEEAVHFVCEALGMLVDGTVRPDDFETVLETHIETHHEEEGRSAIVLQKLGDTLPGLGIVAAVLGVVITMQHVDGKPAEIGHYVAVALVGTFLGVLLSYGYVQPLAANLEGRAAEATRLLRSIKGGLVAFARGAPPLVAVEVARHVIFSGERPDAGELSEACRSIGVRAA